MPDTTNLNEELGTSAIVWNLDDLYVSSSPEKIEHDIAWCEQEAVAIKERYYGTISSLDPAGLFKLVHRLEQLDIILSRLSTYSFLNFTTQLNNANAGSLDQRIHELHSTCSTSTVFFELEWNSVEDDIAASVLASDTLAGYRHYLQTMRRYRPHQLSEIEEQLLLKKEIAGKKAWTTLFSKVLSGYKYGEAKRNQEQVLSDLYSSDREVRKKAADDMTAGLQENSHILTHIFNTLAADKMVSDDLRGYSSWISSMNLYNQLEDSTVERLIEAVTSR